MPEPLLLKQRIRVVVLGAGMAGLAAAVVLHDAGLDPVVLEADARVGGRIRTHRFSAPHEHAYGELGAMRIPQSHRHVLALIDRFGLGDKLVPFPAMFSDPASLIDLHGRIRTAHDAFRITNGAPLEAVDHLGLFFEAVTPHALSDLFRRVVVPALRTRLRAPGRDEPTGLGTRDNLRDALAWISERHKDILGPALTTAVQELLMELGTTLTLSGGMDQLPRSLAAHLPGRVLLRHRVCGLAAHPDGLVIGLDMPSPGGAARSTGARLQADYAVCALPPPVLSTLTLTGLPPHVITPLARHTSAAASKTLLHVREAFWTREGVRAGGSASDQLIRQVYYPPPAQTTDAQRRCGCAVITASYATDADTVPLDAMGESERLDTVVRALARMHPGVLVPGTVLGHRTMDWHRHPYSLGAFDGDWMPDSDIDRTAPVAERVVFAADTYSAEPGWIEGAVCSGREAALSLLDRIGAPAASVL
ncbi:flavin monoamine oxidase family protein [Streptomyces vinaceus]